MLLRELCKSSEINSPLSDLHHLLLALALVVLVGVLPWIRLLGLRAILGEMGSTAAIETSIVAVPAIELWDIWPWAKLLRLLKDWRSESSLLLRRPKTNLPVGAFLCGALGGVFCTRRYLGG